MPRFFFDTDDGKQVTRDDEGVCFPDAETASNEAVQALPELVAENLPDGSRRTFSTTMRDEDGRERFRAELALKADWLDAGHRSCLRLTGDGCEPRGSSADS